MIPISLYVALEIVKLSLAYLLANDIEMYFEEDDKRAVCRTSDLIEELGQVEFIFSDKTGTLTCNVMDFKKCSINGKVYGEGDRPKDAEYRSIGLDKSPAEIIDTRGKDDPDRVAIERFFMLMAVCHTVFPVCDPDNPKAVPRYQAASPDELALVQGSVAMGYVFSGKNNQYILTRHKDEPEVEWEYLAVIPFTSTRKRMSLVVREPGTNRMMLLSKGADNIMHPLLSKTSKNVDKL
jgi:phospholipid-transporting ATPase